MGRLKRTLKSSLHLLGLFVLFAVPGSPYLQGPPNVRRSGTRTLKSRSVPGVTTVLSQAAGGFSSGEDGCAAQGARGHASRQAEDGGVRRGGEEACGAGGASPATMSIRETRKVSARCSYCGVTLASRNKLYQHLREPGSPCEAKALSDGLNLESGRKLVRRKVILTLGYSAFVGGEGAAAAVVDSLEELERRPVHKLTRCTDHKLRCSTLLRTPTFAAVEDCFVYTSVADQSGLDEGDRKQRWLDALNCKLAERLAQSSGGFVEVTDREIVHPQYLGSLQAEGSCTARIYECLLPWGYLSDDPPPDGNHELRAVASRVKDALRGFISTKTPTTGGFKRRNSAECVKIRERERWHNFAFASAEPSDAAVQRTVDRFFLFDETQKHRAPPNFMVWHIDVDGGGSDSSPFVRLRIKGDGVLRGQVEAMVGSAACVLRGWLPVCFGATALDPRALVETPKLPPGLVFFVEGKYDYNSPKQPLFKRRTIVSSRRRLETKIHAEIATSDAASEATMLRWLEETSQVTCPRICAVLVKQEEDHRSFLPSMTSEGDTQGITNRPAINECPTEYATVLRLLRAADASGLWPATSRARARVIVSTTAASAECEQDDGENSEWKSGSFSVASPAALALQEGVGGSCDGSLAVKPTRGNELFPELARAVFELEKVVAPLNREPSTMVAVNRRAIFRPHTDAGVGFGQSMSLIVGLGDYVGGGLAVEGEPVDVRYAPLEFDGWRQRHWTLPYEGERFSLVWFTPAASTSSASGAASGALGENINSGASAERYVSG